MLAFAADPMTRWTWPRPHQYLAAMPDLSRAFGGGAFTHGGADCTDGCSGAALWLAPGLHPDTERMDEIFGRTASPDALKHMPSLFERLSRDKKSASVFPITEYWLDIGRMDDFNKANDDYVREFWTGEGAAS